MKINANIVVVLFFFPATVVYMLSTRPKELFDARQQWRTYLGLLVCWAMLWMPVVVIYRLVTGSL